MAMAMELPLLRSPSSSLLLLPPPPPRPPRHHHHQLLLLQQQKQKHRLRASSPSFASLSSSPPSSSSSSSSSFSPSFLRFPFRFPSSSSSASSLASSTRVSFARQSAPIPRRDISELTEYDDDDDDDDDDDGDGKQERQERADGSKEGKRSRARRTQRNFATEAEAKRHHWISRMWAPWEEALSPEAQFAVDALNLDQGDEPIVPIEMMNRLEVNEPLIPDDVDDDDAGVDGSIQGNAEGFFTSQTQGVEPNGGSGLLTEESADTMVFSLIPPRDWPPPGWEVDPDELAYIRGLHEIIDKDTRIPNASDLSGAIELSDENPGNFPRWDMFVKQYLQWVDANKSRLDKEAEEVGDEYYPGRRRMGEEYVEGMFELPFIYPGQHYIGEVTMVHLYEGAFVNFGAVHDGWVPIKRNDWFWIRDHIKVGMRVQVEVIAKRDPYRFRFPIQLRFVNPNIDHLIFNRFKHPPIFVRDNEEENMDLITREVGRPFWPRRRPEPVENRRKPPKHNHPYSFKVWQLYIAEKMVLDDEENRAAGVETPTEELLEVNEAERDYIDADSFWTEEVLGGVTFDSLILTQHESELDLVEARKEREAINKAWQEAESKGEVFEEPKPRRIEYIEKLDIMHWQRYLDEHEAVQRDKVNRLEFGLPLEEPGKYADDSFFGENKYNPREKRWRHDYIGDTSKSKDVSKRGKGPNVDEDDKIEDGDSNSADSLGSQPLNTDDFSDPKGTVVFTIKNGELNGNGEKMVNGTESSKIIDLNGLFNPTEEEQGDGME